MIGCWSPAKLMNVRFISEHSQLLKLWHVKHGLTKITSDSSGELSCFNHTIDFGNWSFNHEFTSFFIQTLLQFLKGILI